MSLALICTAMILRRKIIRSYRKIFHNYFQEFAVKTRSSNHSYQRTPQLNHFRKARCIQGTQVRVFWFTGRKGYITTNSIQSPFKRFLNSRSPRKDVSCTWLHQNFISKTVRYCKQPKSRTQERFRTIET